jgi:prolyl oligopeptidase
MLSDQRIPEPPETAVRPVTDILHGTAVTDDYRWLEIVDDETLEWVHTQNRYTDEVLGSRPEVAYMKEALTRVLAGGERYFAPAAAPGIVFLRAIQPGRDQAVLLVNPGGADERVVFDPTADPQQPSAVDWYVPSPSGRLVAIGTSVGGSEDATLRVFETTTGREREDRIAHARFAGVAWLDDESGFYYTSHPERGQVPEGEELYHQHVRFHRLGTSPEEDPDLFGSGRPIRESHRLRLSTDQRWLYLFSGDGWRRTDVRRLDLTAADTPAEPILMGYDATFEGVERGGKLLLKTNHRAPECRIVAVDPDHPEDAAWEAVVEGSEDLVLRSFVVAGDVMAVHALKHVSSTILLIDLATGARAGVDLPTHGMVSALTKGPDDDFLFLFESFVEAPALYRLKADGSFTKVVQSTTSPLAEGIVIRQDFYRSPDGTPCPIYLVHRHDLGAGPHPTLLTGYGGFNITQQSHYIPDMLPWVAAGGVYAQANMRGGGEYGEGWHRSAMEAGRQRSFDDFAAAARYLIAQGITDRDHLGVSGRSLGGLVTGVLLTQHPDLATAVVSGVPLLDMLRYHLFLIGALWIVEYGSPEVAEQFQWLQAYSPYHHVHDGMRYPATYFIGAMNDGRVDALHARKMAALLQRVTRGVEGSGPILLRSHFDAGHGAGKPVSAVIADQAETWGFLAWRCGLAVGQGD